ncbi:MAG: hypothetical protein P8N50_06040, partial [Actinomycetota bacterium]|nr:hypothetical protein [Actinomycetota bacterium]
MGDAAIGQQNRHLESNFVPETKVRRRIHQDDHFRWLYTTVARFNHLGGAARVPPITTFGPIEQ